MNASSLIIADDHPLFRTAMRHVVGRLLPHAQVIEAESLDTLQEAVAANPQADLILLDLRMPGAEGLASLLYLRSTHPAIPVVIVSATEDPAVIHRSLDFGASGFIHKSASIDAIGEAPGIVLDGGICLPRKLRETPLIWDEQERDLAQRISRLTPQQLKVLLMLANGHSNKDMASSLEITESTVKAHITVILRKLGVERRTQAAIIAQRQLQTASQDGLSFQDEED